MPAKWPSGLITELTERRCAIFMGAGVSMGSVGADGVTHPPSWEELLLGALDLIHSASDKKYAKSLILKKEYLAAAEVVESCCNRADFGAYMRRKFLTPHFVPSRLHEIVLNLDPKVAITTNYDQIYDTLCSGGAAIDGYNKCSYYEDHAVDNLRSTTRLISKRRFLTVWTMGGVLWWIGPYVSTINSSGHDWSQIVRVHLCGVFTSST